MGIESSLSTPLAAAVRAAGSQSAFGRIVGRNQSTVFDWLRDAKPLPAEHVLKVEGATGISRHALRPDIYPNDHVQPGYVRQDVADHFNSAGARTGAAHQPPRASSASPLDGAPTGGAIVQPDRAAPFSSERS